MRMALPLIVALLMLTSTAEARPGFYIGSGIGFSTAGGQETPVPNFSMGNGGKFTTDIDGGLSVMGLRMGYNIMGYGALELSAHGHGHALGDAAEREWAAHVSLGARIYPAWHWRSELPTWMDDLEPSLFLGWGGTWQVYNPYHQEYSDEVGFRGLGGFRFGLGLEYFVTSFFKVGFDYMLISAPYDTFIFNMSDGITGDVDDASNTFNQVLLTFMFHFEPAK